MNKISKLTKNLSKWFLKETGESESPLLLQTLEERVLYSAVPLPVDNVDAPVENTDLDDVQFIEIDSNTTLPIGEAIAEETSSKFLAQDTYTAPDAATSAEATLEDLDQLVNSFEQNDTASTEDEGPRTAMGLAEATPDAAGFYTFDEGQSFTIDYDFLRDPTENSLFTFGQGFTLLVPPSSGEILVNGEPLEVGTQTVTSQEINDNLVVFVPDPSFVGNVDFTLQGDAFSFGDSFATLYEGVADDGVAVFGDTFALIDGSAPVFETTSPDSETHVESLSNGGYVVVSTVGASDGDVMFQIFDNDGVPIGSPVQVANKLAVDNLTVTTVDDGGFLVGYASSQTGNELLNIHRFTETGQELNFLDSFIELKPTEFTSFDDIDIEFLGEDKFVISFIQSDTREVKSEIFDFGGSFVKVLSDSLIQNSDTLSVGTELLSDGRFVRTRVVDDGGTYSIFSSIFDPGGFFEVDVAVASGITGSDVSVVSTTDNGFAVVFENTSNFVNDVFVAKLDNSGNIITSELVANNPNNSSPDIVTLDDGSFVVSITSVDSAGIQDIVGLRLNADLTPLGDAFKINSFSVGDQTDSELAVLNDGKLVATFKSDDQATPAKHFHQRLRMSTTGDEDSWISLNSVVGIDPSSTTEVFETLEITGLPIGSKISTGQTDTEGKLIYTVVSPTNQNLLYNPTDIGPLQFMAPANVSGTIEATATLTTNDGMDDAFVTEFQVVVNPVDDAPTFSSTVFTTDEDTSLTMTQAEFIGNFIDTEGELPADLLNSISNVDFVETDFEDRISSSPSPTSGISSSYVFDGTTPLTADLPAIGQAASLELWMRWEDFTGNDRIIAQLGDENQGFSIIQRQDEVVLQFKSDSSDITELSAAGLGGIEGSGSYDQIVVSFGSAAGDPNKLDAAIYLNGELSESINDVLGAHFADVVQVSNTINLGSAGGSVGVGASTADNFGGELGLLRFENSMLDADAVQERYNAIRNAPRIIGINGQILESASTINFTSNQNNIASTFSVLANGDLQFDPQSDFNQLTHLETETATTDVVIQRGAEIFDTVTELNVVGVNDLPVQQYNEITIDQNGGTQIVDLNSFVIDPDNFMGSSANPPANIYVAPAVNGARIISNGSGFQIELVPSQLLAQPNLVLNIVVVDANNGEVTNHDLTINIVDGNSAPVIPPDQTFDVVEGSTAAGNVTATDPNGDPLTFTLNSSVGDTSLFTISSTGALTFNSAPNFENPLDADLDKTYEVTVVVNDSNGGSVEETVTVNVTDRNEAPVITVDTPIFLTEGETEVTTVSAVDPDGDNVTISLNPTVQDNQFFQIDAQTGELTFLAPPDFENPQNEAGDNRYAVRLTATSRNHITHLPIAVFVQNVNDELTFTVSDPFKVKEGELSVGQVSGTTDMGSIDYSIPTGSGDGDLFQIDADGNISFRSQPDFETPQDSDGNNFYNFSVTASSALLSRTENVTVEVTNVNESPIINFSPIYTVNEGELFVETVTVTDPDGDEVTLSIIDTALDPPRATIDALGNIFLSEIPDFEVPPGDLQDNEHKLTIVADDGNGGITTEAIEIHIVDLNDAPKITPISDQSILEGETFVATIDATDQDGDPLFYSIKPNTGDGGLFKVDANGNIEFISAPDYDAPNSTNNDNSYTLTVVADDQNGETTEQLVFVDVTEENHLPVIGPTTGFTVVEGETEVDVISTSDADGDTVTLSIVPAVGDGDLFHIASDGTLSFDSPPDFENPMSSNNGTIYTLTVMAEDPKGGSVSRIVNVEVLDANESPVIIADDESFIDEGNDFVQTISATDPDGDSVIFSIFDDGEPPVFTIDQLGRITFINTPDYEMPFDAGGNNIDEVTVVANDSRGGTATQTIRVTLRDVNEAPVFVGDDQQLSLDQDESSTASFDLLELFEDPENQSMTLEIAGGADAGLFHIVDNQLTLIDVPELIGPQSPTYEVQIVANDGSNDSEAKTVNLIINNINDAPESSINAISVSQVELSDASFGLDAQYRSDADGDATSLVIAGDGPDNSLFEIVNDRIQFIDPPTWENGGKNTYVVTTALNDGTVNSEIITFEITVENINDRPEITDFAPVINSIEDFELSQVRPGIIVADLNQAVTFDKDGDPVNFLLHGTGADNGIFFIDGNNRLRFATTPLLTGVDQRDFEVSVVASDGQLTSAPETIRVSLKDTSGVNVVDNATNSTTNDDPQIQVVDDDVETSIMNPEMNAPQTTDKPDVISTAKPETNPDTIAQPISQRRNDTNGITASSDSKIGDDDVFFELTSDSVSYAYQSTAQGPQLITQEIGDLTESRSTFEDMKLEECMLAKYFWRGFEDSEDEFIRRNLQVDNTTIVAASAGLSLGLVSYLRFAAMATTVVTQLPAWKTLDVSPLIREFDEEEAETIHQIVDE